jgi:NADH:ubiquinone oxidoreductase subunit H
LRVDHLMEFAWKWLLPLAFLNLLATGLIYNLVVL